MQHDLRAAAQDAKHWRQQYDVQQQHAADMQLRYTTSTEEIKIWKSNVDALRAELAAVKAKSDQAELDKEALRVQLVAVSTGPTTGTGAAVDGLTHMTQDEMMEYGRDVMRRCTGVAQQLLAGAEATAQKTIDEQASEILRLEAEVENAQTQVQEYHDLAAEMGKRLAEGVNPAGPTSGAGRGITGGDGGERVITPADAAAKL